MPALKEIKMFTTNGGGIAQNETDVVISIYARDFVDYRDENRVLQIPSEIIIDEDKIPVGRTLYLGGLKNWEEPFNDEPITKSELEQVYLNLIEASDAFDYTFKFD